LATGSAVPSTSSWANLPGCVRPRRAQLGRPRPGRRTLLPTRRGRSTDRRRRQGPPTARLGTHGRLRRTRHRPRRRRHRAHDRQARHTRLTPASDAIDGRLLTPTSRRWRPLPPGFRRTFWDTPSCVLARCKRPGRHSVPGAAAIAAARSEVASCSASTRATGRSSVEWYRASPSSTSGRSDVATPTLPG
jgi:hypothetical protein